MNEIEISKVINGNEVKAITTFSHPSQFGLMLKDTEFKGVVNSCHIMFMALGVRRYVDKNRFTNYGIETANRFIDILNEAYLQTIPYKFEIQNSAIICAEQIILLMEIFQRKLKKVYVLRSELKTKFKNKELEQTLYMKLLEIVNNKIELIKLEIKDHKNEIISKEIQQIKGLLLKDNDKVNINNVIISHFKYLVDEEFSKQNKNKGQIMIQGEAYWISPNGEIYKIENRHINFVGKNPSLFEMNIDEYQDYFKKYNEPFGWEGFGRKEMFVDIFKRGWIRIRENSKTGWTAELCNLNEISKKNLLFWCNTFGTKGGKFSSEKINVNVLCNESNQIEINFMIIKSTISELIENGFLNK